MTKYWILICSVINSSTCNGQGHYNNSSQEKLLIEIFNSPNGFENNATIYQDLIDSLMFKIKPDFYKQLNFTFYNKIIDKVKEYHEETKWMRDGAIENTISNAGLFEYLKKSSDYYGLTPEQRHIRLIDSIQECISNNKVSIDVSLFILNHKYLSYETIFETAIKYLNNSLLFHYIYLFPLQNRFNKEESEKYISNLLIKSRNFESAYSYQVSIISANKAIGQKEEFVRNILQNELDYLKSNGKDMNIQKKDELIEKIEKRLNE